ncbi:MAG: hypothetical protein LBD88_03445 [Candidatus Peribacteria bacterium]|jgi:hypothetical protein|nr:hypothetical protein [Candidatus Peribacteria bacterium]
MIDDDIDKIYIPGELQPKGYYKKIKSVINLSKIIFPEDTALGTFPCAAFPITKKDGFGNVQTVACQIIYLNTDIIYSKLPDYHYPENKDWPEDSHLVYSLFSVGLKVKKYFEAYYHSSTKNSEFEERRIILWLNEFEILNNFKKSEDPRILKAWKFKLKQGPFKIPNAKLYKEKYKEEFILKNLWIE